MATLQQPDQQAVETGGANVMLNEVCPPDGGWDGARCGVGSVESYSSDLRGAVRRDEIKANKKESLVTVAMKPIPRVVSSGDNFLNPR